MATEASPMTAARVWYDALPAVTRSVLVACVGVYVLALLSGFDELSAVCLSPYLLVARFQVWRVATSPLVHVGVLHVAFNMLAFAPMSSALERTLGSVQLLHLVAVFVAAGALAHTALAWAAALTVYPQALYECSVGFSGCIFGLIVLETHLNAVGSRSIFGLFHVPARWYPVALLAFLQLLMPGVSLLGHLSGLAVGYAYANGFLDPLLLSRSYVATAEGWALMRPLSRHPAFISCGADPRELLAGARSAGLPQFAPLPTAGGPSTAAATTSSWRAWLPGAGGVGGPAGGAFSGRGRTLGGGGGGPPSRAGAGASRPPVVPGPTIAVKPPAPQSEPKQAVPQAPPAATTVNEGASGSSSSASSSSSSYKREPGDAVDTLVSMGFDAQAARDALTAANGQVELAVEFLSSA